MELDERGREWKGVGGAFEGVEEGDGGKQWCRGAVAEGGGVWCW